MNTIETLIREEISNHSEYVDDKLSKPIIQKLYNYSPELGALYLNKIETIYDKNDDNEGFLNLHVGNMLHLKTEFNSTYLKHIEPILKKKAKRLLYNNDLENIAKFYTQNGDFKQARFWVKKISDTSDHYTDALARLEIEEGGLVYLHKQLSDTSEPFDLYTYYGVVNRFIKQDESLYDQVFYATLSQLEKLDAPEEDTNYTFLLFRLIEDNKHITLSEELLNRLLNLKLSFEHKFNLVARLMGAERKEIAKSLYQETLKDYVTALNSDDDVSGIDEVIPYFQDLIDNDTVNPNDYLTVYKKYSGFDQGDLAEPLLKIPALSETIKDELINNPADTSIGMALAATGYTEEAYKIADSVRGTEKVLREICVFESDDTDSFDHHFANIDDDQKSEVLLHTIWKQQDKNPSLAKAYLEKVKDVLVHEDMEYHRNRYIREFSLCYIKQGDKAACLNLLKDSSDTTDKIYCLTEALCKFGNE